MEAEWNKKKKNWGFFWTSLLPITTKAEILVPCCSSSDASSWSDWKAAVFLLFWQFGQQWWGSWVLAGGLLIWVTEQLLAVVRYALASVCQLGSLTALATDANSPTILHVQHHLLVILITQIIHQKHLTIFNPAPHPTYTCIFARSLVQYSLSFFSLDVVAAACTVDVIVSVFLAQWTRKNPKELQGVSLQCVYVKEEIKGSIQTC